MRPSSIMLIVASVGFLIWMGATSTQPATQPSDAERLTRARAILAMAREEIQEAERQLVRVEQLERTIAIVTPLLADRSKAASGDLNGDGKKDTKDLSMVYLCQGVPASQPTSPAWFCDMDRDGKVDSKDMELVNVAIHEK
jgi:hypothetical protein